MYSTHSGFGTQMPPCRPLEARYAYYRRCQQLRRNGEQCKAPAMKGETICYSHAAQAETETRLARQRAEVLSLPGAGLNSPDAIQRTIGGMMQAVIDGRMDLKAAGRLIIEVQRRIRLQDTSRDPAFAAREPARLQCLPAFAGAGWLGSLGFTVLGKA